MNALADLLARLPGIVLRLVLGLSAAVILISLLLASLLLVLGMSLWSLITGRRPAPLVAFGRMRERSRQYSQGMWRPGAAAPGPVASAEVVDIEAREVPEPAQPPR